MNRRKGFTLVELVIVIAVIAILAGVLIGTFASVLSKANDSAKLQEIKSQEHEQKANDLLKKIENSSWYGWEDLEVSIVEKIIQAYENGTKATLTKEEVEDALKLAIQDYAYNKMMDNTELTEEQAKAIVENALGTFKYENVTEAQVRAIVSTALPNIQSSVLSSTQIKKVIDESNKNNLTQADVASIVAKAGIQDETDVNQAVSTIVNKLSTVESDIPSSEDINDVVDILVPSYVTANTTGSDSTKNTFEYYVKNLNSGSTIIIGDGLNSANLTISTSDMKTLYIKASSSFTGTLTINAENADVGLVGDFSGATVNTIAVAQNSLHVYGIVNTLNINKGRVVVESSGKVNTLIVIPSLNSTVNVNIEENAKVENLCAQFQDHNLENTTTGALDYINIYNNGIVEYSAITASEYLAKSESQGTTTTVNITNGTNAQGTKVNDIKVSSTTPGSNKTNAVPEVDICIDENPIVSGKTDLIDVNLYEARIGDVWYETLKDAVTAANSGKGAITIKLLKNVEIQSALTFKKANLTLDLNGKTLTSTYSSTNAVKVTKGLTMINGTCIFTGATNAIVVSAKANVSFENVKIETSKTYGILVTAADVNLTLNNSQVNSKSSKGKAMCAKSNCTITIENNSIIGSETTPNGIILDTAATGTNLTINNSKVVAKTTGLLISCDCTITIENNSIIGAETNTSKIYGICVAKDISPTISINNSTIYTKGTVAIYLQGNGQLSINNSIVKTEDTCNKNNRYALCIGGEATEANVEISGTNTILIANGTTKTGYSIYANVGSITLSGGTYTGSIKKGENVISVAPGYTTIKDGNTYTVVPVS